MEYALYSYAFVIVVLVVTILNDIVHRIPVDKRVLSVQVDGATENWCKTTLAFGHILVASGRFDEVLFSRKLLQSDHIIAPFMSPKFQVSPSGIRTRT